MKKLPIVALLVILLIACAPVMPQEQEETPEEPEQPEEPEEEPQEEPEETPEETPEEPERDTRDLPTKEVTEGELVSFPNLKAVDPDGDPINYTFSAPLGDNGEWQTDAGDAGEYVLTITASDGTNTVSQEVLLIVLSKNKAPFISLDGEIMAKEGETFTLIPTVTDPEGDTVNVTYSGWMDSESIEIGYDDAGLKKVIIQATDGMQTATMEVIIDVKNTNRAPSIGEIDLVTVKEGATIIALTRWYS